MPDCAIGAAVEQFRVHPKRAGSIFGKLLRADIEQAVVAIESGARLPFNLLEAKAHAATQREAIFSGKGRRRSDKGWQHRQP
ncbi:hypothetical protein [Sphingobium sp. EM0848]|uniref:hypothetical protein n=1 Tax=Sphingobium sp. EM0848 TaxID=2743473 RepID=UPI00159CBEFB|nr:hypothetical protein [Sphingobium sp. EM0848]